METLAWKRSIIKQMHPLEEILLSGLIPLVLTPVYLLVSLKKKTEVVKV